MAAVDLERTGFQVMLALLYELYAWQPTAGKPKAIGAWNFQQATQLSRRTVKRTIRTLEDRHLIQVQRAARRVSIYGINPVDQWTGGSDAAVTSGSDARDTRGSDAGGHLVVTPASPLRNKRKEDKERLISPAQPALSNNGNGHKATDGSHKDLLPEALATRWYQQGEQ